MAVSLIGSCMLLLSLMASNHTDNHMFVLIGAIWGATIVIDKAIRDNSHHKSVIGVD